MVEILKQNQYVPMSVSNQIAIIYAGINGFLDNVGIENISKILRKSWLSIWKPIIKVHLIK